MRDTLYDDTPLEKFPPGPGNVYPWTKFVEARQFIATNKVPEAIACWREIITHPGLESRLYAQAWYYLRAQGVSAPPEDAKQILGVIIEVGMPKGLDLLAAYPDHSARYYNFSGRAVIWEHPDATLNPLIDALLSAAARTVAVIGPWTDPRPGPQAAGQVRLSFLTPSGLHFGQGPMKDLVADQIGGPVLKLGAALMKALIEKTATAGKGNLFPLVPKLYLGTHLLRQFHCRSRRDEVLIN